MSKEQKIQTSVSIDRKTNEVLDEKVIDKSKIANILIKKYIDNQRDIQIFKNKSI